jgi:alpha-glucosidase
MKAFIKIVALCMAIAVLPLQVAWAKTVAGIDSPDHTLHVSISLDGNGRPSYALTRNGNPVIGESRLGLLLTDAPKLERNFAFTGADHSHFDHTWTQPWGEEHTIRNRYNELRVHLKETTPLGRRLDIVFRVYNYGIGFRYKFPDQPQLHNVHIANELTEFDIAEPATAWWEPGGEWNRYEYLYNKTPLDQVSLAHTPLTMRTADGLYLAIHEAALINYSGMRLRRVTGQRLKASLAPSSQGGARVSRVAPFASPWRMIQIATSPGALYMSSRLELNLNAPNKLGDVSWFKPFKYVGIWWAMHIGKWTWATGPNHGATTEHAKEYIDFAAKNGFHHLLIEGWNKGWDTDWFGNGKGFSFTQSAPDFDLKAVTDYGHAKGVKLIGHHETGGDVANYEAQLDAALDLDRKMGIDGVKTGYVADAGGIRLRGTDGKIYYGWHDSQAMSRHYLKVVTEAAKRHIAIDTHEPIKATGLRRTYPNWVSREGARGMEYNAWGDPPNPPSHIPTIVFTRMLSGPFDYTPGVFSLTGKNGQRIQSTLARQLALYVVIYSPIVMAADLPEDYARFPKPFRFIKDVPTDWSKTRVVNAKIGKYVTFARKDRHSDDWYLGAVTDNTRRDLPITLDFLDPGRSYTAEIYRDGKKADWKTNPFDIVIEKQKVRRGDKLTLTLARGGGEAIRFVAGPKAN